MKHSIFYTILLSAAASVSMLSAADAKKPVPVNPGKVIVNVQVALHSKDAAKIQAAQAEWDKLLANAEVKPEEKVKGFFRIAQAYLQLKDNDKALAEWQKVLTFKDATAANKVEAYNQIANLYSRQKKVQEAQEAWDKILTLDGADAAAKLAVLYRKANDSFRSNFQRNGTNSTYFNTGIEGALKIYQDALKTIPDITNEQKIELAKRIADCYLELMKVETANKTLADAAALPGLTDAERAVALYNYAVALKRELEFEKALAVCMDAMKKSGDKPSANLLSLTAELIVRKDGVPAAEKFLIDNKAADHVLTSFYRKNKCYAQLEKMMREQLKGDQIWKNASAITELMNMAYQSNNIPMMRTLLEKEIPEWVAKETDAKKRETMQKVISRGGPPQYSWHLEREGVTPMLDYTIPVMLAKYCPDCLAFHFYMLNNKEIPSGDKAVVIARIDKILASKELRGAGIFEYSWKKAVLTDADPVPAIRKLVEASDDKEKGVLLAKTFQNASKFAMKMNQVDLAKKLWNERNKMLKAEPKRSLACPFIENGPRTVDEFAASAYVKDPKNLGILDRKFGNNLKFILETDATTTNRNITGDVKDAQPTRFAATCDEQGVNIFFIMPCDPERLKNIKLGYGGYGGYEMYLAFGYDQPYQCYMPDGANTANVDVFSTQYDNESYRNTVAGENTRFFTGFGKDCIYMLMQIDWCGVMNGIPVNGFKWEFEPIHWERGGWTWGGSKSVHNRSSFGDLVFANMTEKNRTLIKRRLLSFAKRAYQAEFNARNGGVLEHWMDPDLGDQEFYFKHVKPFCDKFGPMVNEIKADMTDEQVNKIYDEAYSALISTKYVIERLRREYLAEKFVMED